MDAKHAIPASYEKVDLPDIKLSHYPEGSETATPVAIITLNRPGKGNAFTPGMAQSLEHAFNMFHIDDRVKVIVLTGAGRLFCAGSDLGIGFNDGNKVAATDYRDMYVIPLVLAVSMSKGNRMEKKRKLLTFRTVAVECLSPCIDAKSLR